MGCGDVVVGLAWCEGTHPMLMAVSILSPVRTHTCVVGVRAERRHASKPKSLRARSSERSPFIHRQTHTNPHISKYLDPAV